MEIFDLEIEMESWGLTISRDVMVKVAATARADWWTPDTMPIAPSGGFADCAFS